MLSESMKRFQLAALCLLVAGTGTLTTAAEPLAVQDGTAAATMQSVFANRLRDGGFWRQDNPEFEPGTIAPKYWMQVWSRGPGDEVVIVDAYEVRANNACTALIHIVYRYDRETGLIKSSAFGANGMSGQGVMEFEGTVTRSDVTLQLPGGGEMRMRDREDQGSGDVVVVEVEMWDGDGWTTGESTSWKRAAHGPECE